MGRKKRDMSYLLPFCYYCEKTFKNDVVLHQHQKAKHFTCIRCQKKFSTADSLKSHMSQAHRESLNKVPNALHGRDNTELKIFGMSGVPKQYVDEKVLMGAAAFWNRFFQEKSKLAKKDEKAADKKAAADKKDDKKDKKIKKETKPVPEQRVTYFGEVQDTKNQVPDTTDIIQNQPIVIDLQVGLGFGGGGKAATKTRREDTFGDE